jgi:hypothetical protein
MADEQPLDGRPYPEHIDLGRIQSDLELGSNRRTAPDQAIASPATALCDRG